MTDNELKQLQADYDNAQNQLKFVAAVLSAESVENECAEKLKCFSQLLDNDFVEFARKDSAYNDDSGALRELKQVECELQSVTLFPILYTKNIISVAGGFSSGKSKFLNTLFKNNDIQLSIGIEPVTAIPTYISSGDNSEVVAVTTDGKRSIIPAEIFSKVDHKLINSLGFNLKSIMPYVTVSTQFRDELSDALGNVCFIDTPGYDAAGENSDEDSLVAFDAVKYSSAIIWAVPCTDGTIHTNSINFINQIKQEDESKRIFILCTKADLKPTALQEVMSGIRDTLEMEGIEIDGICAVASKEVRNSKDRRIVEGFRYELTAFENYLTVFDFIKNQNNVHVNIIKRCSEITDKIDKVYASYRKAIETDIDFYNEQQKKLDDFEIAYNDYDAEVTSRFQELNDSIPWKPGRKIYDEIEPPSLDIDPIKDMFKKREQNGDEQLNELSRIFDGLKDAVYSIFRILAPNISFVCPRCGNALDPDARFCGECDAPILNLSKGVVGIDSARADTLYCSTCGFKNYEGDNFCLNCGNRLND